VQFAHGYVSARPPVGYVSARPPVGYISLLPSSVILYFAVFFIIFIVVGKVCSKCNVEKSVDGFHKDKWKKDGLRTVCKDCSNSYAVKYRNSEEGIKKMKEYNQTEDRKISLKKYQQSDKGKEAQRRSTKKLRQTPEYEEYRHEYNRRDEVKERNNKRVREDRKNNPEKYKWRALLKDACGRMNTTKSASTIEMLKYSADELFNHLYSLGYKDTDHIDHKIPLSWFHADTPQHIVNHLSNLQPMDPFSNISKGNCYADRVDEEYYQTASEYIIEEYL